MSHRVSVAMASFNGGKYIAEQIESLLNQSLKPSEIIVSDDGSTDDTIDVLEQYKKQGHLSYFRNTGRQGVTGNFVNAVSLCSPDNYIALCDQDDSWLPEKLEQNVSALAAIDTDNIPALVYSDLVVVNEKLEITDSSFWKVLNIVPEHEGLRSLMFGNFITGCTVMMNREMSRLFREIPEDYMYMHDAWLAMIAYTFGRQKAIQKPLVLYRQHGGNITFETNTKNDKKKRVGNIVRQMTKNEDYLANEILMVKKFKAVYGERLTQEQSAVADEFIGLQTAFFLRKKLSSVLSRRYRFF